MKEKKSASEDRDMVVNARLYGDLLKLSRLVRSYCRRERKDAGSLDMVEDWSTICQLVGVNPKPRWDQ